MRTRSTLPKEYPPGIVAVPTSLTSLTTTDTQIKHLVVANNTAGALTLLVTDAAGNALVPTVSIASKTQFTYMLSDGDVSYLIGGMKWQASGIGLTAEMCVFYK